MVPTPPYTPGYTSQLPDLSLGYAADMPQTGLPTLVHRLAEQTVSEELTYRLDINDVNVRNDAQTRLLQV